MTQEQEFHEERLRRWRLMLGAGESDGIGFGLSGFDKGMDQALSALYGQGKNEGGLGDTKDKSKQGGMESSAPSISRWLGDIREYFPSSVVQIMQEDAIQRVGILPLLNEPELIDQIEPDVNLVATLLSLNKLIPEKTRGTARIIVRKLVEDLMRRLQNPMRQAIHGALNRAQRTKNPRHHDIHWHRTIVTNLKHYQPELKTIIPETLIGYGRKRSALREVILCVDQSGSMASSVVYSSVFGAVMASLPALKTHMIVFDTAVVDLTQDLHDPVDLLFGTALGGGTDINRALGYCQQLITRPQATTLILISDLYEGGNREEAIRRAATIAQSGVTMVALLALDDHGRPSYDKDFASELAALGIPAFACTPDLFPDLMATALNRQDLRAWASRNNIPVAKGDN
jgi:Mg-chelatase subunit ChlD